MPRSLAILAVFATLATVPTNGQTPPGANPARPSSTAKPKVWIYSDASDKTLKGPNAHGTINDPDDISALAGYLLMANEFETLGIVVTSTSRELHKTTPDQGKWADETFGTAYRADLPRLNKAIGGYPDDIAFHQSSIKPTAEKYNPKKTYETLDKYPTVKALLDAVTATTDTVNVLCWGPVTEPAILVNHCLATGKKEPLARVRFIAHWTNSSLHQGTPANPEKVANCSDDSAACAYLKYRAAAKAIRYHECGAIGQAGIVKGSPKGAEYYEPFKRSPLGKLFAEGKFVYRSVDHSDSATYWVLLGGYGVELKDIAPDGTNPPDVERANEAKFAAASERLHNELKRRATAGTGKDLPTDVVAALKTHDKSVFVKTGWIRDPYIVLGSDGYFYLTGTTPLPDEPREKTDPFNTGLGKESIVGWKMQAWRSKDLAEWESLGTPFTLKNGVWFTAKPDQFKKTPEADWRLWAPELHEIDGKWAIIHTSPSPVAGANLAFTKDLKLQGPFTQPMGEKIARRHDPSLFKDDDGSWWLIWGATQIAKLKKDFSDLDGKPVTIGPGGDTAKMGHEGCLIRKIGKKYVLFGTGWSTGEMRKGSYNLYYATADTITGPYTERKFAGRFLGHGTPFQDKDGRWWSTAFYNGNVPPLARDGIEKKDLSETAQTINKQGVTLVPLDVTVAKSGEVTIRAKDPAYASPGPDEKQKFNLAPAEPAEKREKVNRTGDWVVKGKETVTGKSVRLDGNLVLESGAVLELENCDVEIVGKHSREHLVDWKGGKLVTKNVTIGGTPGNGAPVHTVFHVYDGVWEAMDTTVQYSYGVSFGDKSKGVLKGTRFKAGPRPDAVIASGKADITLVDSDFPLALGVYTHKGGSCALDLPVKKPITATYDAKTLTPGVEWRMELTNTTADHWFVFLRNIGMTNPACEVSLGQSDRLIVSLLGNNLTGELVLSNELAEPIRLGSLTVKRSGAKPPGISMYALYFSGDKTDMTVRGETHICELMHRGGKLKLSGAPGKNELSIGCTTLELSNAAEMTLDHVHLGRPLTWQEDGAVGEANVVGNSRMVGDGVSVRGVRFRTREKGVIDLKGVERKGKMESKPDGGPITLQERK